MARLAVGIEYDGTRFTVGRRQSRRPTVQSLVEELALPWHRRAAGRSPSAPGARTPVCTPLGQVVHFDSDAQRSRRPGCSARIARSRRMSALRWVTVGAGAFSRALFRASRSYRYWILNRRARSALARRRAWRCIAPSMHAMQAAGMLLGEHDFSAFRAAECQAHSPVRRLMTAGVSRHGTGCAWRLRANAFLHHMVRNIVGLLVAVGRGEPPPEHAAGCWTDGIGGWARPRRRHRPVSVAGRVPAQFGLSRGFRYHRRPVAGSGPSTEERLMSWFKKIVPSRIQTERRSRSVPEGLWVKCAACDSVLYRAELERNLHVCPKCSHHMRIGARARLEAFLDPGSRVRWAPTVGPRIRSSSRTASATRTGSRRRRRPQARMTRWSRWPACSHGEKLVACAFEFQFLGGSMGSVVGERFMRASTSAARALPAGLFLGHRRRAHAGGVAVADADGQDQRRRWRNWPPPGCRSFRC